MSENNLKANRSEMFKDIKDILELSNTYTFVAFVFFLTNKEKEEARFDSFMARIKQKNTFDDFVGNIDASKIDYIKTFSTKEQGYKNFVLFNPSIYENLEAKEVTEDIQVSFDSKGDKTDKLVNFLYSEDCFITGFINKLNRKSKISTPRLRAIMFKQPPPTNIETLSNETEYVSQVVSIGKKDFILKKKTKLRLVVDNEKILATAKLGFPNTVSICLNDKTYLASNKVSVYCDLGSFKTFEDKLVYIYDLYKDIFGSDLTTEEKTVHVTLKRPNKEELINNPLLFTPPSNIVISEAFISFKYMRNLKSVLEKEALISQYYEKQKKMKEVFSNNVDESSLLFMSFKNLTAITEMLPLSC